MARCRRWWSCRWRRYSGVVMERGESARWAGHRLVLVDIPAGRLLSASPPTVATPAQRLTELAKLDQPLAAVAPVAGRPGVWLAAAGTGFVLIDDGDVRPVASPEPVTDRPWRMNDGVADRAGRFWAGSMACDQTPECAALYRLDPDGSVRTVLRDLTVANGPAFSPDGRTMYLSDAPSDTWTASTWIRRRANSATVVPSHAWTRR
jgi:sugar lactone lactonase YvrE